MRVFQQVIGLLFPSASEPNEEEGDEADDGVERPAVRRHATMHKMAAFTCSTERNAARLQASQAGKLTTTSDEPIAIEFGDSGTNAAAASAAACGRADDTEVENPPSPSRVAFNILPLHLSGGDDEQFPHHRSSLGSNVSAASHSPHHTILHWEDDQRGWKKEIIRRQRRSVMQGSRRRMTVMQRSPAHQA